MLNKYMLGFKMNLPKQSSILMRDAKTEIVFHWDKFDGDDCFASYKIKVTTTEGKTIFDFGGCVVNGVRKMDRFLAKPHEQSIGSGFRNPESMYYDLYRKGEDYKLIVQIEGKGPIEFVLNKPEIINDRKFISQYDGEVA